MSDQKRRIGGSVIPKILGVSRFGTPHDAYLELVGEKESFENEDTDRGNFLEPALRAWARKRLDRDIVQSAVRAHPYLPWATYSPDGIVWGAQKDELLEIKAPGPWTMDEWGEEGTDEVPSAYVAQGQWGLFVLNLDVVHFAALIDGKLKMYRVERDDDLIQYMKKRGEAFWKEHVEPRVPPPLTAGDDEYIRKRFPKSNGVYRQASELTPEQLRAVQKYAEVYRQAKVAERTLESWEPVLKEIIGDANGIDGFSLADGFEVKRIDWKNNATPKRTTNAAAMIEAFVQAHPEHAQELQELWEKHTKETEVRPLNPRWFKGMAP